MLDESKIQILERAIKFKYEEHISSIIRVPKKHMEIKDPDRWWPVMKILEGFNRDTGALIQQYGESLKTEISKIIESFNLKSFSKNDKEQVLNLLSDFLSPDLYQKRFSMMLNIIEIEHKKYGLVFEKEKHRIDLPAVVCEVGAFNLTRRALAKIDMELDCLIQKHNTLSVDKNEESIINGAEKYLELKPNIMGVGINLNAIIKKLFGKGTH